jgi:ATP-dependent DNA helicase RecG
VPPYTDVQGRAKIRVGKECLPLTGTLRRKIAVETGEGDYTADNPISTIREGIVHFEHRRFPEIAIREALVNAFCHADLRLGGPLLVKQSGERLEIGNPGGFIGGITAENILHHRPVARNPCLVDALVRLRIVNRSSLGVPRMYRAMLIEGKEPPRIVENGDSVTVTFRTSRFSLPVRLFVDDEARLHRQVSVDQLLIVHYLLRHAAIGVATAARICQRSADEVFDVLDEMQAGAGYLDRQGSGPEATWHLSGELMLRLAASTDTDDWRAAKALVLKALRERSEHGEPGLSNSEIREMVSLDRNQVYRLMHELRQEVPRLELAGAGRWARYRYRSPEDGACA